MANQPPPIVLVTLPNVKRTITIKGITVDLELFLKVEVPEEVRQELGRQAHEIALARFREHNAEYDETFRENIARPAGDEAMLALLGKPAEECYFSDLKMEIQLPPLYKAE
ncbi:MAG: hypothetical protein Q9169_002139 [Polycauliona sp. 2 TL-2023]